MRGRPGAASTVTRPRQWQRAFKHGVSLADAAAIEWETVWLRPDHRRSYGETRMIGIGYIGLRPYGVVFTDRGVDRCIISLRKANARVVASYAET